MSDVAEIHDLFSGVMCKMGGKVKTWHKRYFVLKSDYCLYYYKDSSKQPLGTISLHDSNFDVRRGGDEDMVWPKQAKADCRMSIVTMPRTYFVYCDYSHEMEEWMKILIKSAKKVADMNNQDNKLFDVGRSSSGTRLTDCTKSDHSHVHDDMAQTLCANKEPLNYESVYDFAQNVPVELTQQNEAQDLASDMTALQEVSLYFEDQDGTTSPSQIGDPFNTMIDDHLATHINDSLIPGVAEPPEKDQLIYENANDLFPRQPLYELLAPDDSLKQNIHTKNDDSAASSRLPQPLTAQPLTPSPSPRGHLPSPGSASLSSPEKSSCNLPLTLPCCSSPASAQDSHLMSTSMQQQQPQGMNMFIVQKQRLELQDVIKRKTDSMHSVLEGIMADSSMPSSQMVVIAETLREVRLNTTQLI